MDDKLYVITLSDGTKLKNLLLNGDNFISGSVLYRSTFEYNLDTVIIDDGEMEREYHNMELIHLTKMPDGKYWFTLRELSEKEIEDAKLRADVDYLYMMTDLA